MATKIFVNLPVKDLNRSKAFFANLGFSFNPQFTDEKAACMIIDEDSYVMLITEDFFKRFIKKEICDTSKSIETIVSLSAESREIVDEKVNTAVRSGGQQARDPEDYGWMYQRSFLDPDGHQWEVIYMDMSRIPATLSAETVK